MKTAMGLNDIIICPLSGNTPTLLYLLQITTSNSGTCERLPYRQDECFHQFDIPFIDRAGNHHQRWTVIALEGCRRGSIRHSFRRCSLADSQGRFLSTNRDRFLLNESRFCFIPNAVWVARAFTDLPQHFIDIDAGVLGELSEKNMGSLTLRCIPNHIDVTKMNAIWRIKVLRNFKVCNFRADPYSV